MKIIGVFMVIRPSVNSFAVGRGVVFILAGALFWTWGAFAEANDAAETTEVVVTANRIVMPRREVASSVTVITADEIAARAVRSVTELLRTVPGVDVVQSGASGGNAVVFIRGANSEHTLVLIDGVVANGAMNTNRAFNFQSLSVDNIERIEVLRGPQSTLYGSDALGGVISITTKKGEGAPQVNLSFEGGSYSSFTEQASVLGSTKGIAYSLAAGREDRTGISSAGTQYGNEENDGFGNTNISGRVNADLSDVVRVDLSSRYQRSRADIDDAGGLGGDDVNRIFRNEEAYHRVGMNFNWLPETFQQTASVGFVDQEYHDDDDAARSDEVDFLRSRFRSDRVQADLQNELTVSEAVGVIFGAAFQRERGSSSYVSESSFGPFNTEFAPRSVDNLGFYGQVNLGLWEQFYTTAGIRVDDHEQFGSEVTWRIAPTWNFANTGTKLSATVGTGFKAPSLYQLYSEYGFIDLAPEESLGLDVGIEQALSKSVSIGVTYFYNDFDNLISFDPDSFIFSNVADARTSGLETFVKAQLSEDLTVRADYTFTDTEDRATGEELLRRARHKVAVSGTYRLCDRTNVTLSVTGTGRRFDNDFSTFPAARTRLAGYAVVDLMAEHALSEQWSLYGRVHNLFDQEYEEVLGYGAEGAGIYGGIRASFG